MPLAPGYGETPLPHDELTALNPSIVGILDVPITRAAVYDLEQGIQDQVSEELITAAIEGSLLLDELLSDYFVRDLHSSLYGDIWVWAGRLRQHEVNIGVAPEQIAVELRSTLDNIRYRWERTDDFTPRVLGVTVHAETVRIHPFVDGNGRTTRLLADLVYIAAQERVDFQYDWDIGKTRYIELLREFDVRRNADQLAHFIGVQPIEP
ncbi:fido (protein-threonine AMPylation protein) [Mycobacterium sp. MAA66]|uniref:Fic family protein n=1 Tax=Mycobacterium sp. MAA66 TaxID=3156297 RepID=UPI003515116D